jgi:hypothetical protein
VLRSRIILHHFDADPDADPSPAFYFNPDPNTTFHSDADPDPTFKFDADLANSYPQY